MGFSQAAPKPNMAKQKAPPRIHVSGLFNSLSAVDYFTVDLTSSTIF